MIAIDDATAALQRSGFQVLTQAIDAARTICICAHTGADGDALGSVLALARIIDAHWECQKDVTCLLADNKPVPRAYRFLPDSERLVPPEVHVGAPDLFIACDLNHPDRLADARAIAERAGRVFVIDHHPPKGELTVASVVRPEAAACGVIVTEYALFLGEALDADTANLLFVAIVTDTGRFQYQNADAEAFGVASLLVDFGANPSCVALHVYQSFRLEYLKLKALVMGRIALAATGRVAYSWALWDDFLATGAAEDESDGLIDVVRSVEGTEIALFARQVPGGTFRCNLRSKGSLDVSGVAQSFGGGGHPAAAGFSLAVTSLDEVLELVLPALVELVERG